MARRSSFHLPIFDAPAFGEQGQLLAELLEELRGGDPHDAVELAAGCFDDGFHHPLVLGLLILQLASEGMANGVLQFQADLEGLCHRNGLDPPPAAWRTRWLTLARAVGQGHRRGGPRVVNRAVGESRSRFESSLQELRYGRPAAPKAGGGVRARQAQVPRKATGPRKSTLRKTAARKRAGREDRSTAAGTGRRRAAESVKHTLPDGTAGPPRGLPEAARALWDRVRCIPPQPPPPGQPVIEFRDDGGEPAGALVRRLASGGPVDGLPLAGLARAAVDLGRARHFDQLLVLNYVQGVEHFSHQIETTRRVLRDLHGRALLADEVGLGKTIEAGLIAKEYLLRGQVRSVLILCPPSLVGQWKEEMADKFGLTFRTPGSRPEGFFTSGDLLLCSLAFARREEHQRRATARRFDLVIVDEAHHVKNRRTAGFRLVDRLKRRFLLLLTATPVQNRLDELYGLVTLLRPGHLSTAGSFSNRFVTRGDPRRPRDREQLRELLTTVMIRNTRALVDVRLPPRFVRTVRVEPTPAESDLYDAITDYVRARVRAGSGRERQILMTLLSEAGSSPAAVLGTLDTMLAHGTVEPGLEEHTRELQRRCAAVAESSKGEVLLRLLAEAGDDRTVVFVKYRATLAALEGLMGREGIPCAVFHGGLSARDKQRAIDAFGDGVPVLLSTASGGEGRNLQFCRRMVSYDLPWNPFAIEQRIGRIHRIGQTREVHVANLCAQGSAEEYLLEVLDEKLNMFELVIGELDMILGDLQDDLDIPGRVLSIWTGNDDERGVREGFDRLGEDLQRARGRYEAEKELDDALFGRDYEVT